MIAPLPAAVSTQWVERLAQAESPAFTTRRARRAEAAGAPHDPIVWAQARGANVVDVDGNVYVDLSGGFGVAAAGHGHPAIVEAAWKQANQLVHALGDLHPSDVKIQLLERLQELAPFEAKVALGLTGSDAIDVALKTAVLATGRSGVVAFEGGYHGLSYGPLAACGYAPSFRAPFQSQLNPDVSFVPFPGRGERVDTALEAIERRWPSAAPGALIVEPVQARGGVRVPPPGFLAALGELCRERGTLVIADEIFTGFGRCGARFRSVADGLEADLLCLGKALGGGFPISACLGRSEVMRAWGDPKGMALHTGTFFGNPVSCAAALKSLDVMDGEHLTEQAEATGQRLMAALAPLTERPGVVEVRGAGLLVGLVLDEGRRSLRLVRRLLERGYLALPAGSKANVLQVAPPLNIPWELLQGFVETLSSLIESEPVQSAHVSRRVTSR